MVGQRLWTFRKAFLNRQLRFKSRDGEVPSINLRIAPMPASPRNLPSTMRMAETSVGEVEKALWRNSAATCEAWCWTPLHGREGVRSRGLLRASHPSPLPGNGVTGPS